MKLMTIGGGCFWCTEAVFDKINGVQKVVPGYSGGNAPGVPTYREVCSGLTGHAEVIQVRFNPEVISYKELLEIFMTTHNPTTLNRQGGDVGTQYRSVIFYHDEEQKQLATEVLEAMKNVFDEPIVTALEPLDKFYTAEKEHHNFYEQNPEQGYCQMVISPKLAKFRKMYADKLKG